MNIFTFLTLFILTLTLSGCATTEFSSVMGQKVSISTDDVCKTCLARNPGDLDASSECLYQCNSQQVESGKRESCSCLKRFMWISQGASLSQGLTMPDCIDPLQRMAHQPFLDSGENAFFECEIHCNKTGSH